MITLQALFRHLETLFAFPAFSDYGPNGIQVEGSSNIRKIGLAVTASCAVIDAAAAMQVDALIVHHGIFWEKDEYPIIGTNKRKIAALIANNISLLAYHLPLDMHKEVGNNWKAAIDLGWKDLQPFGVARNFPIGVKGAFNGMSIKDFKKKLEHYYGQSAHVALGGKEEVKSAALISGGAWRYVAQAADEGVDCFITGSFDEPAWDIAHEKNINFLALGHHSTERVGIIALTERLKKDMNIPVEFIDIPNPF